MCACPNDPDLIGIVATKVKWSKQPVGKSTCWNRHGWVIRILEQPPRHRGRVTVSGSGDLQVNHSARNPRRAVWVPR